MSKEESSRWFNEVLPAMACILLRFPSLLEVHYLNSDNLINGTKTGLRVLSPNKAGIVFLISSKNLKLQYRNRVWNLEFHFCFWPWQELIGGALLSCSFFCLFPFDNRGSNHLPIINFDKLFGYIYILKQISCPKSRFKNMCWPNCRSLINTGQNEHQENKIKCIIHYFQRLSSCIPPGFVSFERKILSLEQDSSCLDEGFWRKSTVNLCPVEVMNSPLMRSMLDILLAL